MEKNHKSSYSFLLYLPIAGLVFFVLFYIIAALHYPGGTIFDYSQPGFSISDNFLCDLLDDVAMNGEVNTAKTYARTSLGILCFSLMLLWLYIPKLFKIKKWFQLLISLFGILSMLITMLMGSGNHDLIVYIAGFVGIVAVFLTLWHLVTHSNYRSAMLGIIAMILVISNYFSYETGVFISYLPLLQKISFIVCIGWFLNMNIMLIKKYRQ